MSCMSGSPNLNSFRDRGQVAVQLVSCGVLLPGLVEDCTQHSCVLETYNLAILYNLAIFLCPVYRWPKTQKYPLNFFHMLLFTPPPFTRCLAMSSEEQTMNTKK